MFNNRYNIGDKVWLGINTSEDKSSFEVVEGTVEEVVINTREGNYLYRIRLPEGLLAVVGELNLYPDRTALIEYYEIWFKQQEEGIHFNTVYRDCVKAAMEKSGGKKTYDPS